MAKKKRKAMAFSVADKLEEIHNDIKQVREVDIPNLKVDVAVVKANAGMQAKIITAIGGIVSVAVSTAIAFLK